MHTTSIQHKYQEGDAVWFWNYNTDRPESFIIESVRFNGLEPQYRLSNVYGTCKEDTLHDSMKECEDWKKNLRKKILKDDIEKSEKNAAFYSKKVEDFKRELAELEGN